MMKYWLLIFLWNPEGYVDRVESQHANKAACLAAAAKDAPKRVNTEHQVMYFCVTDDHWTGKAVDPDVPLDLLDFAESDHGDV